jgi:hypothetical protein
VAEAFSDASGEAELAMKRDIERLEAKLDRLDTMIAGDMALVKWMLALVVAAEVAPIAAKLFQ